MAKRSNKKENKISPKVEVNNITLSNIDRSYKGIPEWRDAIKAAESVDNPEGHVFTIYMKKWCWICT
ncbi:hypothetical protein [Persicobacter sp. CCB-QB2]|uniref:hypothetical protein n=1 Tax=Persicobacter sp. CCB-QB2 TaxID=1561025 RepID=UPI0006A9F8E7|nr:hypothetical protein [Persicobacter sp. CCB-QB2]